MAVFGRTNPNERFDALKKAAADARAPFDKDMYLNLAFYLDKQYVEWTEDARTIRIIPRAENQQYTPRPVVNKIMHFVQQEHAMTLQDRPTVDVMPASDDPIDLSDASVAKAYTEWVADPQQADFDGELSDATHWALAAGEGYLKWVHNGTAMRGDVLSVPPFDVYGDPYVKMFRKSRYVIHSQFMDTEQVYDLYGVEVKEQEMSALDPMRSALLREMGQAPVLKGVIVNELWYKPCRRYPKGLFTVWTGRTVLVEPQPFPYLHKHLPFTQIGSIPHLGSPHYINAVKFLRSPQMELNKYHAQRIMIREAFANPKWWIDDELELEEDPDDSPRQILRGNSGGGLLKPEIIQPTTFPGNDDGQWITEEMMNVVGLHEVSQGGVPGRVEAASAISDLKETDILRLAEMKRTIRSAVAEGYWQLLMLAKQYVPNEILVTTYSREGLPEVKRFKSDMVKPGVHVKVTMADGLASSRGARQQQVIELVNAKVLTDPEQIAELLDIHVASFSPVKVYDIRLARNENLTLAEDTAIVPNSWDDHAIHLREHNNYRKSSEFLAKPLDVKTKFEFHCQKHEDFQRDQLVKQAQLQAAVQMAMQPMQPPDQQAQTPPGQEQPPPPEPPQQAQPPA